MNNVMDHILRVEDKEAIAAFVKTALEQQGYAVHTHTRSQHDIPLAPVVRATHPIKLVCGSPGIYTVVMYRRHWHDALPHREHPG
jgi:DNA-binding response OmpR family regulator